MKTKMTPWQRAGVAGCMLLLALLAWVFGQGCNHSAIAHGKQVDVKVTWDSNIEPDLDGYYVYVWDITKVIFQPDSTSGKYSYFDNKIKQNVNVVAVRLGKQTFHTWVDLQSDKTYRFGVSAFDTSGNESQVTSVLETIKIPDTEFPDPPAGLDLEIIIRLKQ